MRDPPFTRPDCEAVNAYGDAREVVCGKPASFTVEDAFVCTECAEEFKKADDDLTIRAIDYTCAHCGKASLKRLWGPGWITCPACRKRAPRASESV